MGLESKQDLHTPYIIKIEFRLKLIRRNKKEGHIIRIKGTVNHEDITLLNLYSSNSAVPNFIKNILLILKTQTIINLLTVGDF